LALLAKGEPFSFVLIYTPHPPQAVPLLPQEKARGRRAQSVPYFPQEKAKGRRAQSVPYFPQEKAFCALVQRELSQSD